MIKVDFRKINKDEAGEKVKKGKTYQTYNCYDELNQEAIKKATDWVNRSAELYDRFNVGSNEEQLNLRIERARIGILGELAFAHLLDQLMVPYELDVVEDDKNCDSFDFKINGYTIDVKVGHYCNTPDYWATYGYPVDQCRRKKDFVIVGGIKKDKNGNDTGEVEFYGYIPQSKITSYPKTLENSAIGYSYFTPNHEFPIGALKSDLIEFLCYGLDKAKELVCPKCGSPLVSKKNKFGEFIGCSNYPNCNYIQK